VTPTPPTSAAPPPGTAAPVSRRAWWTIVIGGSVLVLVGIWFVIATLPRFLTSTPGESSAESTGGTPEERRIQATLFYVSPEGEALVGVNRAVPYGATPAEQARRIVEAQVAAAPEGAASAFPPGTTVRHVFVTDGGDAYVDLGPEIVKAHSGGSLNESLTVFALVNALTTNLPDIKAVQILIDGKEVDTLAGHIDLHRPLEKSQRWIRR
jgi:hypothetical protein